MIEALVVLGRILGYAEPVRNLHPANPLRVQFKDLPYFAHTDGIISHVPPFSHVAYLQRENKEPTLRQRYDRAKRWGQFDAKNWGQFAAVKWGQFDTEN